MFGKVVGGGLPLAARRRPRRRDGRARAARPRVPGGHALGEPARHRRRARGARRSSTTTPTRSSRRSADALRRRPARRARRAPASRSQVPRVGTLTGLFFAADAGARLRRRPGRRPRRATRASSTACSTAASSSPPSGYETMFVSLAHTDADIDAHDRSWPPRPRQRSAPAHVADVRRSRRPRVGGALAAHVVHEEQRAAEMRRPSRRAARTRDHRSRRPRRRRRRAAVRPRAPRARQRADRVEASDEHGSSQHGHTFAGSDRRVRAAVARGLSPPRAPSRSFSRQCSIEQAEHEQDRRREERDERRAPAATRGRARGPRTRCARPSVPSGVALGRRAGGSAERLCSACRPRRTAPPRTAACA